MSLDVHYMAGLAERDLETRQHEQKRRLAESGLDPGTGVLLTPVHGIARVVRRHLEDRLLGRGHRAPASPPILAQAPRR